MYSNHTHTLEQKHLFDEFTTAFDNCDELILMDIYAAREADTGLVSSDELGDAIRARGIKCTNAHSHEEAANILKSKAKSGDIILNSRCRRCSYCWR